MASNTALGYQMMIEERLLDSMRQEASNRNFYIACAYGVTYAKFLGVEDYPDAPMKDLSQITNFARWEKYYFELLQCIVEKMKDNLVEVRSKYGKLSAKPNILKVKKKEENAITN